MEITQVNKKIGPTEEDDQPRFELDQVGSDLPDHKGIKWVYLLCPYCNTRTKFKPIHLAVVRKDDDYGLMERDFHYLCQCEFCQEVIYAKFWEVDFDPDWTFQYELHHPVSLLSYSEYGLPELVWLSFSEANKCLNAGAYLAVVVMCRRTIEGILKDKGAPKNLSLAKAIEKLADDSTIHESMKHLADLVRVVGNIGAHASELKVDEKRAKETYELTQKLIDMLYVLPKNAERARNRIDEEKKPKSAEQKNDEPAPSDEDVPF
ncbi:DUF4145 domain-containing protein [Oceanobacter kriegii]|uniref:DUF4145 domain-containing protein n=1 Tax=Oceanobacter kriegii TaxID=64972 RepID=UPI0004885ED2|nr:DUF4145 domain-containing protein [Oceanobacter kriegii]